MYIVYFTLYIIQYTINQLKIHTHINTEKVYKGANRANVIREVF